MRLQSAKAGRLENSNPVVTMGVQKVQNYFEGRRLALCIFKYETRASRCGILIYFILKGGAMLYAFLSMKLGLPGVGFYLICQINI